MSQLSPSEKKGLLLLLGIILVGFIIQWLQPFVVKKDLYDYTVQDSIFRILSADTAFAVKLEFASEKNAESRYSRKTVQTKELLPNSININTANQTELELLPRIGPATAKNILDYRQANGGFKTLDELVNVKRIGPKTLETIKPYLIIN
jgi:comEA protein